MSGIKESDLAHFLRLIQRRLGNAGMLAQFAGVGRCHLSSMLHGDVARGLFTWAKVRRMVTAVEWSFLEKCSAWNSFARLHPEVADTVRRTPCVDSPRDPLMHVICADCGRARFMLKCIPAQGGKVSHGLCHACFRVKIAEVIPAYEIDERVRGLAAHEAADPTIVPIRPPQSAELSLSPA